MRKLRKLRCILRLFQYNIGNKREPSGLLHVLKRGVGEVRKKLPVGIENFEEIRTKGFYYVDKTGLIKELLENWGKETWFTRPRRFGKSLNMRMLKGFFERGGGNRILEE